MEAWLGDERGNLVFRGTARNFNPDCAKAAKVELHRRYLSISTAPVSYFNLLLSSCFAQKAHSSKLQVDPQLPVPSELHDATSHYMFDSCLRHLVVCIAEVEEVVPVGDIAPEDASRTCTRNSTPPR
eukprot:3565404-Amphidinium_carterae.1